MFDFKRNLIFIKIKEQTGKVLCICYAIFWNKTVDRMYFLEREEEKQTNL